MNKKAANIQTLARLDALEADLKTAQTAQTITVDDIRNTIHQIADMIVQVSEAIPVILADIKALADLVAKMTTPDEPPPAAAKKVKKP